jgi:hypothetical protein
MTPKPLSNAVHKGFAYLIRQQHAEGGWSQGGGWRSAEGGGRVEGPDVQDPPDVANTCVATMALLRGGHTPCGGEFAPNVLRALDFIVGSVERADHDSPYVTDQRGTQVQTKIGPYADTFLTALALAEAKGQMPTPEAEERLQAALNKTVGKMERHQQADGTWTMHGWAPVVSQSLGTVGLNRAKQRGANVSDESLERSEYYSRSQYDHDTQTFSTDGSAGVPLYASASHLSAQSHSVASFKLAKEKLRKVVDSGKSSGAEKAKARERLKNIQEAEEAHEASLSGSYAYFKDENYRQGFGSNGGEEFLSYLNISETLVKKGGKEWEDWDRSLTENLERIQNGDGSWSGHHCITGRTFCTATALLVLLADRVPQAEPAPEAVQV